MKLAEKEKAIELREKGTTCREIMRTVGVSKSTLSIWLRDVVLSKSIKEKILVGRAKSQFAAAEKKKSDRKERTQNTIAAAKEEFLLLARNPLFISGLCLYWAEGDKHKQERVKFTNSDERMVAFMMKWFREICEVPEEKFRIALHVHDLFVSKDIKKYWSKITGIPEKQFQKVYIKQTSLRERRNILYNGTCGIVVSNKELFRRISGWKLGFLEYFNISPRSLMDKTRDF